jgi:hypothetical protein
MKNGKYIIFSNLLASFCTELDFFGSLSLKRAHKRIRQGIVLSKFGTVGKSEKGEKLYF